MIVNTTEVHFVTLSKLPKDSVIALHNFSQKQKPWSNSTLPYLKMLVSEKHEQVTYAII